MASNAIVEVTDANFDQLVLHPLLVDDDRGRQRLEHVDIGPRLRRHEALHEGAVGLVDQPLRLGRDRVEHRASSSCPSRRRR